MPTGFPKDPVAYAAKQAARREERAAARTANGGEPPERTTTRLSAGSNRRSSRKTPAGPKELAVVKLGRDLAEANNRLAERHDQLDRLNALRYKHDQVLATVEGLERRAEKAEGRMNAVLDLVTKAFG